MSVQAESLVEPPPQRAVTAVPRPDDSCVPRIIQQLERLHGTLRARELLILLGQITAWAKDGHLERGIGEATTFASDAGYLSAGRIRRLLDVLPSPIASRAAFLVNDEIRYQRIETGKWRMLLVDVFHAVWANPIELSEALLRWWTENAGRDDSLAPPAEVARTMLKLVSPAAHEDVYCIGSASESIAIECMRGGHRPHVISAEPPYLALLFAMLTDKPIEHCPHELLTVEAAEYFHQRGRKPTVAVTDFGTPITDFEASHWRRSAFGLHSSESMVIECIDDAVGTRATVLVPDGVLHHSGPEQQLRAHLIEHGRIQSVVAFPAGLLASSATPFSLITLDMTRRTDTVVFFEVDRDRDLQIAAGQRKQYKRQFTGENELLKALTDPSHASARRLSDQDIRHNGYNLNVSRCLAAPDVSRPRRADDDRNLIAFQQIAAIIKPQALRSPEVGNGLRICEVAPGELPQYGFLIRGKRERLLHPPDAERYGQQRLRADDVLLCTKGIIGRAGVVWAHPRGAPLYASQSMIILRLTEISPIRDPAVLMMFLRSPYFQTQLQSLVGGTTVPNVPLATLRGLPLLIPTLDEQIELRRTFDEQRERQSQIDVLTEEQNEADRSAWDHTRLMMCRPSVQ